MKKINLITLGLLIVAIGMAGCSNFKNDNIATQKEQKRLFNIATSGTGGTWYPLGGALANLMNKNIPNMNATAQTTGGTVANINLLQQHKVDMAFLQNDTALYATNGTKMFKDKAVKNMRGLAALYPETIHIVTLKSTGIKSIKDFKGKRIAVGPSSGGTKFNASQVLEAYGMTFDDIKPQYLSFGEASNALKDGNVDAAFVVSGFPNGAVMEVSTQRDVVFIPIDSDKQDYLVNKYPFFTKKSIDAGTYINQNMEIPSVASKTLLVATENMDEETAYNILKTIYANIDKLSIVLASAKEIKKETSKQGMTIEWHKGAEKFFNEK